MKPTRHDLMSRGDQVFLMRTERVAELAEKIYPSGHPARDKPVVVQRFIDTGEYPESYRVLTLFGETLYCMRYRQSQRRVSLKGSDRELLQYSIASTAGGNYVHAMIDDAEVLAFARRAAAVMPAIPLQGIDIIRDARTGALYVLENNSGGNTWHFSSKMSAFGRSKLSREARIEQFGAFDIAAKVLAERTLKLAR
jgi:predicted ATP-grasp superfamily ATP-dependent carboligase